MNAGNDDRANLAHVVSTLGAALRSLDRMKDKSRTTVAASQIRFQYDDLNLLLWKAREDERNARSNSNPTGLPTKDRG